MVVRIVLVLLVVAAVTGLLLYSQVRHEPLKVSGFVEADEIRLGSRVGGRIQKVLIEEGERVRRDQPLIVLEPFDLLERQREAQAQLVAAQADYDRLVAGNRPEEIAQAQARVDQLTARVDRLVRGPRVQEITAAEAQVRVAQAELTLANENFRRTFDLRQKNAASQQDLDRATEQVRGAESMLVVRQQELSLLQEGTRPEEIAEAKAQLEEAKQALQLAQKGFRQEDIQQAKAARDAAQAAVAAIEQQLQELTILSPVDHGVIEAMELRPGDLVGAGAPVLSLMDLSKLWVRAYVPENHLDLANGERLWVTIDSFPNQKFSGRVTFISRHAEFTPSNVQTPEERSKQVFRIKVTLDPGPDVERLRPGMSADVWLEEDAVQVPSAPKTNGKTSAQRPLAEPRTAAVLPPGPLPIVVCLPPFAFSPASCSHR